jgi:hypothetical protein
MFLQESQSKCRDSAQAHNEPSTLVYGLIVDHARRIPHQMPDTIEGVVCERPRKHTLRQELQDHRPLRESRRYHCALKMPASVWCDQVSCAEDVEGAAHQAAGDTIEDRAIPGDLRAIDAEVRRDRSVQALFGEDFFAGVVLGHRLGRGEALDIVSTKCKVE